MPGQAQIAAAAEIIREGGLVAFPTETVYGLGADAANPAALRRLYAVKRRPPSHPVIVHLAGAGEIDEWAREVPDFARSLAAACWPGPLTLVLRRSPLVPDEVTGGADTVALRVPDQATALALIAASGGGLAAPSANRFGRVSPTTAQAVREELDGDVEMVLDDGPCRVGVESTVLDCTSARPQILRPGGLPAEELARLLGFEVRESAGAGPRAPGTLPSHYAPSAVVELHERTHVAARASELLAEGRLPAVLCQGPPPPGIPGGALLLASPVDPADYARVLYARLREADARGAQVIIAVTPAPEGIGRAVADRLDRAAARRG